MLSDIALQYLQRFNDFLTESVYASKGIDDYNRMKKYCDYLDYDKITLFREKGKTQAGLRNIGNTCYLNVILQLLFHINYLRQKVCGTQNYKSELLKELKQLFGQMAIGKLIFADPTQLFDYLKNTNQEVFIPGVQNDFHEIFTLLIDKISDSFTQISSDESRFIKKLLFGKLNTKIDFNEGKINKLSTFNIINLQVEKGSFDKALESWKHFQIKDYQTPNVTMMQNKGSKVKASCENILIETPALMTFFINRVTYKNNKLNKDTRVFQFQDTIMLNKQQKSQKTKTMKKTNQQLESSIMQQRASFTKWLQNIQKEKQYILGALNYLKSKEIPVLSQTNIDNSLGQKSLQSTIAYLQKQFQLIEKKSNDIYSRIKKNEETLKKMQEQGNYETYYIWAVMIHQGTTATSGHYKICIKNNQEWNQYNDRIVSKIPHAKILQYKAKGQICCLFYRRSSLKCDSSRIPVLMSLKNQINAHEKQVIQEIDKARLLQALYQQTQSSNILLQYEQKQGIKQHYFGYFFKPVHYAITESYHNDRCKGLMIMQYISTNAFKHSILNRLLSQQANLDFPFMKFGIPDQYFVFSAILKEFLNKQALITQIPLAFEELSSKKIKFTSKNIKIKYNEIVQIIILKGIYYLYLLTLQKLINLANFHKLSIAIDKLIQSMSQISEFALICITIKSTLKKPQNFSTKDIKSSLKSVNIENYTEYFEKNFKFWIVQRRQLSKIDQTNFYRGAPLILSIKE